MIKNRGFTLWFTGLPCAGKTTLAEAVWKELYSHGVMARHLDGDLMRKTLSRDLGFTKEDRITHARRMTTLAFSLTQSGSGVLVSLISPYRQMREHARGRINHFVEIYVRCPLAVCERRDVKGMYKLAREGRIDHFTGISDPYEEPINPEIVLDTDSMILETCVQKIMDYLSSHEFLPGLVPDREIKSI